MSLRSWMESEGTALRRVLEESARARAEAQRMRYRARQLTEGTGEAPLDTRPGPPDDQPPVSDAGGEPGRR